MRLILTILLVASLFITSCDHSTSPSNTNQSSDSHQNAPLPAIEVPWTNQQSVVCFGTSLTYGYIGNNGDYSADKTYPAYLEQTLKLKVYNQGYTGYTTTNALELIGDSVITKNPALVLLEFTANDFLHGDSVQIAENNLRKLIDTLLLHNVKIALVSFLYSDMIDTAPEIYFLVTGRKKEDAKAYLTMLRVVKEYYNIPFVEYAMEGIYWRLSLMSDYVHPNAKGYKIMQENISYAFINTFQQNNMLK